MEASRAEQQKQYKAMWRSKPENKEKEREHSRKYREANLERIKEKVVCEHCGIAITRNSIARHKRTQKCLETRETQTP